MMNLKQVAWTNGYFSEKWSYQCEIEYFAIVHIVIWVRKGIKLDFTLETCLPWSEVIAPGLCQSTAAK